jgi:hypothetical protein
MKRFCRSSLDALVGLSFFLSVGTFALWIAWHSGFDQVIYRSRASVYSVCLDRGNIGVSIVDYESHRTPWSPPGFRVPVEAMVLVLLMPPGLWMQSWSRHRLSKGLQRRIQLTIDAFLVGAGLAAFMWLIAAWYPANNPVQLDDPQNTQAAYIGIAAPVLMLWVAIRDLRRPALALSA